MLFYTDLFHPPPQTPDDISQMTPAPLQSSLSYNTSPSSPYCAQLPLQTHQDHPLQIIVPLSCLPQPH